MSIEKIIAEAIDNNPLKLKEAFEEEMNGRIRAALEEKYREMTEAKVNENDDEDEDDDDAEDHDDEDEDEDDDDDLDEKACVKEMQKRLADGESKAEMMKAVREKYGCSEAKCNELYAQYCK